MLLKILFKSKIFIRLQIIYGGIEMVKHSGGKVGKAGKTLATSKSKTAKSNAGTTLANHKKAKH